MVGLGRIDMCACEMRRHIWEGGGLQGGEVKSTRQLCLPPPQRCKEVPPCFSVVGKWSLQLAYKPQSLLLLIAERRSPVILLIWFYII
jgi:hypothetical protein